MNIFDSGIIRSKYDRYQALRANHSEKRARFKRNENSLLSTEPHNIQIQMTANPMAGQWILLQERARQKLEQVEIKRRELTRLNSRRLKQVKDQEQASIDKQIADLTASATALLKQCQKIVKQIKQMDDSKLSDEEMKIKQNISRGLAGQIQNNIKGLRTQQKKFYDELFTNVDGVQQVKFLKLTKDEELKMQNSADQMVLIQEDIISSRNKDIQALVQSLNQLLSLFKDLGQLIIEQGTILDRIDYNMEQTLEHVERGKAQLQKAEEHQKNSCANKFIVVQIVLVICLCIALVIKKGVMNSH